jgi:steroid delta-isomerase-like uncharacterized protein
MSNVADLVIEEKVNHLVEVMLAALNAHDVEKFVALITADYQSVDVNQALPHKTRGEVRMALELYFDAFPDLHMVEHEAVIADDRAAIMWKARGTHRGMIMHIPPTGKEVEVRGTTVLQLDGEKICKASSVWDVAAMLREIGLVM